jgi:hypothetical protein
MQHPKSGFPTLIAPSIGVIRVGDFCPCCINNPDPHRPSSGRASHTRADSNAGLRAAVAYLYFGSECLVSFRIAGRLSVGCSFKVFGKNLLRNFKNREYHHACSSPGGLPEGQLHPKLLHIDLLPRGPNYFDSTARVRVGRCFDGGREPTLLQLMLLFRVYISRKLERWGSDSKNGTLAPGLA